MSEMDIVDRLTDAQTWMREPDYADDFSLKDLLAWANKRPTTSFLDAATEIESLRAEIERLEAILERSGATCEAMADLVTAADNGTNNANIALDRVLERNESLRAQVERLEAEVAQLDASETQLIAERDEAEAAVQKLDTQTGGDGEYYFSTDDPDAPSTPAKMCAGIAERYSLLKAQVARMEAALRDIVAFSSRVYGPSRDVFIQVAERAERALSTLPAEAETDEARDERRSKAAILAELIECWGRERGTKKFNSIPWGKMIADPYIDRGKAIARAIAESDRAALKGAGHE